MPERSVLLLPSRPQDSRNPVVAVGGLMLLVLHHLDELRSRCESINDVDREHLHDVLVLKGLELTRKDVAALPGITQHCLGIRIPIRLDTANLVVQSPFTFAAAGSSQFISGVIGMKAVNQSIGLLVSLRPYRWRKLMFGLPRTLGSISVTYCCLVGICFLDFLALFFGGMICDSSTNLYRYLLRPPRK